MTLQEFQAYSDRYSKRMEALVDDYKKAGRELQLAHGRGEIGAEEYSRRNAIMAAEYTASIDAMTREYELKQTLFQQGQKDRDRKERQREKREQLKQEADRKKDEEAKKLAEKENKKASEQKKQELQRKVEEREMMGLYKTAEPERDETQQETPKHSKLRRFFDRTFAQRELSAQDRWSYVEGMLLLAAVLATDIIIPNHLDILGLSAEQSVSEASKDFVRMIAQSDILNVRHTAWIWAGLMVALTLVQCTVMGDRVVPRRRKIKAPILVKPTPKTEKGKPVVSAPSESRGEKLVAKLKVWYRQIESESLKKQIAELTKLLQIAVTKDKTNKTNHETLYARYDDVLTRLFTRYDEIENTRLNTPEMVRAMKLVEDNMGQIVEACRQEVSNLYGEDLMDIHAETTVFIEELKNKGLLKKNHES